MERQRAVCVCSSEDVLLPSWEAQPCQRLEAALRQAFISPTCMLTAWAAGRKYQKIVQQDTSNVRALTRWATTICMRASLTANAQVSAAPMLTLDLGLQSDAQSCAAAACASKVSLDDVAERRLEVCRGTSVMSWCLQEAKQLYDTAIGKCSAVLDLEPNNVPALVICGSALLDLAACLDQADPDALGSLQEARDLLGEALELQPGDVRAQRLLQDCELRLADAAASVM